MQGILVVPKTPISHMPMQVQLVQIYTYEEVII